MCSFLCFRKKKNKIERSYFVLNSQCLFIILAGLGCIWCFCMSSHKKAPNPSLLCLSYVRIHLQISWFHVRCQVRTGLGHLVDLGSARTSVQHIIRRANKTKNLCHRICSLPPQRAVGTSVSPTPVYSTQQFSHQESKCCGFK